MTAHRPLSDLIDLPVRLHDDPDRWLARVIDATDEKVRIEWPDESREWVHARQVSVDV